MKMQTPKTDERIIDRMMEKKVFAYMEKQHMLQDGDTVVAGVSGGADSVCLLLLLWEYAKNHRITLIAAHVHHGLRDAADGDEEFVTKLCGELNVPLRILHIYAKKEAEERGVSVEEAGRICRYEFFRQILKEAVTNSGESGKIAVAHHRDDLCETMLFQLFRGSGISGMRGILPVSGDIIRPLLDTERAEIEEYLVQKQISWRTDESNAETLYARNRIRHEIMPVAREICSGAGLHMARNAERLREIEEYISEQAEKEKGKVLEFRGKPVKGEEGAAEENGADIAEETGEGAAEEIVQGAGGESGGSVSVLIRPEITELPEALKGELVLQALCAVAGRKRDIGFVQVDAILNFFNSQVGRKREFIYGIKAERIYEGILLSRETVKNNTSCTEEVEIRIYEACPDENKKNETQEFFLKSGQEEGGFAGRARMVSAPDMKKIPVDSYTKWLNCDKINNCLLFRHPGQGDYIVVNKDGGTKLLKDYFVNEKIPAAERPDLWVLADGSRVLWIAGYRIGEDAKISEETRKVLEVSLKYAET